MYDIETKNLVKKYGELTAVNNVNLLVEEKSLFGLLGVNGAGKTTLIKMLTCLSVPTSGKAFVGGFEISENPDKRNFRRIAAGNGCRAEFNCRIKS